MTFDADMIDEYNNRISTSNLNTSRSIQNNNGIYFNFIVIIILIYIVNGLPILSDITKLRLLRDKNKRANTFTLNNNIDLNNKKYLNKNNSNHRLKSSVNLDDNKNNFDKKDHIDDLDIV